MGPVNLDEDFAADKNFRDRFIELSFANYKRAFGAFRHTRCPDAMRRARPQSDLLEITERFKGLQIVGVEVLFALGRGGCCLFPLLNGIAQSFNFFRVVRGAIV